MADTLNLSLWFPGFDAELMPARLVEVLRHFPFSESRGGVQYASVQPVDWAEPSLFEESFRVAFTTAPAPAFTTTVETLVANPTAEIVTVYEPGFRF